MDSATISQLVFLVFGATVFVYGWVLHHELARLRVANDHARAKLDALVRELRDENGKLVDDTASSQLQSRITGLQERILAEAESFNGTVREYNARIGQFPEAIVAAITGLQRRELFRAPDQDSRPSSSH